MWMIGIVGAIYGLRLSGQLHKYTAYMLLNDWLPEIDRNISPKYWTVIGCLKWV